MDGHTGCPGPGPSRKRPPSQRLKFTEAAELARAAALAAGMTETDVADLFGVTLVDQPGARVVLRVRFDVEDLDDKAERERAVAELARIRGTAGEQLSRMMRAFSTLGPSWDHWQRRGAQPEASHMRAVTAAVESVDALDRLLARAREQLLAEHRLAAEQLAERVDLKIAERRGITVDELHEEWTSAAAAVDDPHYQAGFIAGARERSASGG